MPNEFVIQHRDVIWSAVFTHEYKPWVQQFSNRDSYQEPSSWRRVVDMALKELSIKEFGADDDGNPKHVIQLKARANHSNFPECKECADGRKKELEAIKARASREERQRCREARNVHRREWRTERSAMGQAQKELSESAYACYTLDDKLGGQWIYQPIPEGNREDKGTASHWKYRSTLQGFTLTGKRHLFSIIPPCLLNGNNFGVTGFVAGVYVDDAELLLTHSDTQQP